MSGSEAQRSHAVPTRTALLLTLAGLVAVLALGAGIAAAAHGSGATVGLSTLEHTIEGDGAAHYQGLQLAGGEGYTVRADLNATADPARAGRRDSLLYLGQLTDFQLVDEESPARVEFLDSAGGPLSAAFRPMEAFTSQIADQAIRQVNSFVPASPIAAGDGSRRAMDFAITTGDSIDNMHRNETEDVVTVLAGGVVDPNSGVAVSGGLPAGTPATTCTPAQQAALALDDAEAAKYTGVQDYDDYTTNDQYYDPDDVQGSGPYQGFPTYPNLMDRAEAPFTAAGLDVPTYVTFGNHDALAQGNEDANRAIEDIAIGCTKPLSAASSNLADFFAEAADPTFIAGLANPGAAMTVPPDPDRQLVSKDQYKALHSGAADPNGNGFGFAEIDPAEEAASAGAAGYYSYSPAAGFRFIAIDTVSEGGVTGPSAEGNIDDPQFQWLTGELDAAKAAAERVVLFSHHGPRTLDALVADEEAPPCSGPADQHGHDSNPGCDLDPRVSTPIHLYDAGDPGDVDQLLFDHPNVIAWVNGHSHLNSVNPESDGDSGGFWDIRTAAEIDWPQQSRLLEFFDNGDGTLSIFGTVLDHAAAAPAPPDGDASGFSSEQLASIGRELAYNDPQTGAPKGAGDVDDRNVELLIADPLAAAPGPGPSPNPAPGPPSGSGQGAQRDTEVLGPRISAKKRQRQRGKRIKVKIRGGAQEQVEGLAKARIKIREGGNAKRFRTKVVRKSTGAGKRTVYKLKLRRRDNDRRVFRALRRGKKVRTNPMLRLTDQAGNTVIERRAVVLEPKWRQRQR